MLTFSEDDPRVLRIRERLAGEPQGTRLPLGAIAKLSRELNINVNYTRVIVRQLGYLSQRTVYPREKIISDYQDGMTLEEIQARYGCHLTTVKMVLRKAGARTLYGSRCRNRTNAETPEPEIILTRHELRMGLAETERYDEIVAARKRRGFDYDE